MYVVFNRVTCCSLQDIHDEVDDLDSISEKVNQRLQEGEVSCFFDNKNKKSPCFPKFCRGDYEGLECVQYVLEYCGRYDDRGCVINKPHLLNKKQKEEMEEMAGWSAVIDHKF